MINPGILSESVVVLALSIINWSILINLIMAERIIMSTPILPHSPLYHVEKLIKFSSVVLSWNVDVISYATAGGLARTVFVANAVIYYLKIVHFI